jgi:hypothetical protein
MSSMSSKLAITRSVKVAALSALFASVTALGLACSAPAEDASANGALTSGTLQIQFPVAYSANDGQHSFKLPAMVEGVGGIQWSASDPSVVDFEPNSNGSQVMMTTRKAGIVTITARAGNLVGTARLTVTQAPPQLWEDGKDRYNNGIVWERKPDGQRGGQNKQLACTNCHNKAAQGNGSGDIEHTPTQTAGYSDQDLVMIMTQGTKPPGIPNRVMAFDRWTKLHRWQMTENEKNGLIVYLRSLTPESQGPVDFGGGGHGKWDGGARPEGGFGGAP